MLQNDQVLGNLKIQKYGNTIKYGLTETNLASVGLHLKLGLRLASSPHPQIISTGGEEVRIDTLSNFKALKIH